MKARIVLLALAGAMLSQAVFAYHDDMPCVSVAKACKAAGYERAGHGDKKIWFDCIKPALLGHQVKGVTLNPQTVKECRANKIKMMQKELKELQAVQ